MAKSFNTHRVTTKPEAKKKKGRGVAATGGQVVPYTEKKL